MVNEEMNEQERQATRRIADLMLAAYLCGVQSGVASVVVSFGGSQELGKAMASDLTAAMASNPTAREEVTKGLAAIVRGEDFEAHVNLGPVMPTGESAN